VRKLAFPNGDVQIMFDEGTLDCLFLVGEPDVNAAMAEISRVLKRGRYFVYVSYATPLVTCNLRLK
jgi:hypothetical protein